MMTAHLIDVVPLPAPLLRDGPLTGRVATIPSGEQKGQTLHVGRCLPSGRYYLVSVGGGEPQWCSAESVAILFG